MSFFFFFNDTATTEIYTLSLHDALPISWKNSRWELTEYVSELNWTEEVEYFRPNFFVNTHDILHAYLQHGGPPAFVTRDRKSTRLNSSHANISYAVFCLKKKK